MKKADNARINKELKALANQYKENYETMRRISENRYKTSLKAGQVFHEHDGFYDDQTKADFAKKCDDLKAKAHDLIDDLTLKVIAENTAAPSTEAVNVVALINARQNVSVDEIDQLMTVYGHDCPMVYKALQEKAESLGYHDFKPHPTAQLAEDLGRISSVIDRTFTANNVSIAGKLAGLETEVDITFPAE